MLQLLCELVLDLVQLLERERSEVNCGLTQMSVIDILNAMLNSDGIERITLPYILV